jgi:NADP-dependent 3-hydroxy acid dehydrogenase YdfG
LSDALKDRIIVITGASGGIGSACAKALAATGAKLVLADRDRERLAKLQSDIASSATEDPVILTVDVTSEADMNRMAQVAIERYGRIDALIAAAGLLRVSGQPRPALETSFDEWSTIVGVNLTGTFLSNKAVLPAMIAQGEGDIINISSTSGRQGRAFDSAYCASKFGIVGFSEALAEEVSRQGVRVQTVLPDAVDTGLWSQNGTTALRPRDMLSPAEVAKFIIYLLSLPRDMFLYNPTLMPMKQRAKKRTQS